MSFTRTTIAAGIAALSLSVCAAPAMAKGGGDGGGDINNTVVTFISPDIVLAPTTNSGGGSGGGGKRLTCRPTGEITSFGSVVMVCGDFRA